MDWMKVIRVAAVLAIGLSIAYGDFTISYLHSIARRLGILR